MKKLVLNFIFLFTLCSISVSAYGADVINYDPTNSYCGYTFMQDGIKFMIINQNSVEIAQDESYKSFVGNLEFPALVGLNGSVYNIVSIAEFAFADCPYIQSVSLPSSLKAIKRGAFRRCTSLSYIYNLGKTVFIGDGAFHETAWFYNLPDGPIYINDTTLLTYKGSMPANAHIVVREGTTRICDGAFEECTNLASISIPNSVKYIGEDAFCECTSLRSVKLPEGLTTIEYGTFRGCTSLESVVLPSSLKTIDERAFRYCPKLTTISLPNGLERIGGEAFKSCAFTSIKIPSSVNYIGGEAFDYTPWYTNQPDGPIYINNILYKYKGSMPEKAHFIVREGTVCISGEAFSRCENLASVSIPNSVKSIGTWAFYNCTGLTEIQIPSSVTDMESCVFSSCKSLKSASIYANIPGIENQTFQDCSSLENVHLSSNIKYIDHFAFGNCSNLQFISLPTNLKRIGTHAFDGCRSLLSITIPYSVKYLDSYVFFYCTSLTSIAIPHGVQSIGKSAFASCENLNSVTIPNSMVSIDESAFERCENLNSVVVPYITEYAPSAFPEHTEIIRK